MPIYEFKCKCGKRDTVLRSMACSTDPQPCKCGDVMTRDYRAELGSSRSGEGQSYLSDALGVAPHQIEDAQRAFPDHKFAPDGRMIIDNPQHRKKVLKDLGYVDYN